jgi:CRP/FNR family transcriptional regulator
MAPEARVIHISGRRGNCTECAHAQLCIAHDPEARRPGEPGGAGITTRVVRRGDALFRSGDQLETVYLLRSGAVKTFMISPAGDEQVIGFHGPGDVIGLDAIDRKRHVSNAEALDTSSVCVMPYERLGRVCSRSRAAMGRLLAAMSRKMLRDESMLLMLGQRNAEQRLAAFVLDQAERRREQGFSPLEINLPMSRADIGSYLALAVETVSRVLTRLQEAEALSVHRNRLLILDMDALTSIADETATGARQAGVAR